jgi:hypothetical protein
VSWRWIKVKKRGVLRVEGIDLPGGGSGWAEYEATAAAGLPQAGIIMHIPSMS